MAYDSNRQRTVLFGGCITPEQSICYDDTWEYDGADWTRIVTPVSPPIRGTHALVFDAARNRTVLFSGFRNPSTPSAANVLHDMWEYDGSTWMEITTSPLPLARGWHMMTYDSRRGKTILFGGMAPVNIFLDDTWEFDGTNWQQIDTTTTPIQRCCATMTFDTSRSAVMLLGGLRYHHDPLEDFWQGSGVNSPPTIVVDQASVEVDEGQIAANTGTVSDPNNDPVTLSASVGTVTDNGDGTLTWSFATSDGPAENQTVTITADDGQVTSQVTFALTVNNVRPTIESITAPADPVAITDQPVNGEVRFSDPGTADTHDVTWKWGDQSSDTQSAVASPASQAHNYTEAGVYPMEVTVSDNDDGSDTKVYEFIVIYDPEGGFVTGGGWIYSDRGWCQLGDLCAGAEGKANFGFSSKYKKGASIPTGNTEFQFTAGNLNFHSSSYQWLVVNQGGTNGQFKGAGTINGDMAPNSDYYKFMIWATDGTPDKFRIKIWYEDAGEIVVYDNGFDRPIGGGNIRIHDQ